MAKFVRPQRDGFFGVCRCLAGISTNFPWLWACRPRRCRGCRVTGVLSIATTSRTALRDGQRQNAEHQVAEHLVVTAHTHKFGRRSCL